MTSQAAQPKSRRVGRGGKWGDASNCMGGFAPTVIKSEAIGKRCFPGEFPPQACVPPVLAARSRFAVKNSPPTHELLTLAIATARAAGAALTKRVDRTINSEIGHDVKMQADVDSETLIRERLLRTKLPVIGEEIGGEIWGRFTVHYTPKHGSWLNQAEIEISLFARQCLGARRIPDLKTLRRETQQWNRRMNRIRKKINWRFDRRAARLKFGYKKNSFKRSKT